MELTTLPVGKLQQTLKVCWDNGIIVVVMGPPGCGKTQIAIQTAAETNRQYTEMLLAGRDVGDVFMPYVSENRLNFHYNPALPIKGSQFDGQRCVLNIDEFSGAKPLMQNLLLKVFDERKIGEAYLADDVALMATGNRAWDLAHVEQLSAALGNRAAFITVEPDLDAFISHGVARGFNPVTLAWVKFDPTYLFFFNAEQFLAGDPAFCSPRSNERVSKLQFAYDRGEMDDDIFRSLVCGTIGNVIGTKYVGFQRLRGDMPDTDKIMLGTEMKVPTSPDVIYATIFACVQKVTRQSVGNVINYVTKMRPEWHQMFNSTLVAAKPMLAATSEYGQFAAAVANR